MSMEARLEAARRLAALDTDAFVAAVVDETADFLIATGRFTPPEAALREDDAHALLTETQTTVALIERRLATLTDELHQLPRAATVTAETGTRVDFAG